MSEMTEPTIDLDGLIAHHKAVIKMHPGIAGPADHGTLKYLQELKRIKSVNVPVEPEIVDWLRKQAAMYLAGDDKYSYKFTYAADHIDTLLDLLKRESASVTAAKLTNTGLATLLEEAESKLAAVMKLGNEPSEEMKNVLVFGSAPEDGFKAMFAKLVEQAGVGK
jgi:hypothetical protein